MQHKTPNFLEGQAPNTQDQNTPQKPQKLFFIVGFLFFLIVGVAITSGIIHFVNRNNPNYALGVLEAKKPKGIFGKLRDFIFSGDTTLSGNTEDRINILILGQGGPGHDGPYLTDTIIIASVKPSTKEVAMVSIPRDLNVIIPGHGKRKINNANAFAEMKQSGSGPDLAIDVIEDTFQIPIHYFVRVDFAAFEELIDKVGGIDIHVDQAFVDLEYPVPGKEDAYPISSRYKTLSFKQGNQHMDGRTALEFARSRHGSNGEGSDYARSRRQQKVILALKEKLLSFHILLNPGKINDLIKTVESHILTNIGVGEILEFAQMAENFNTQNIRSITLDDSPNGYLRSGYDSIGAFILEPKTGNFNDINNAIATVFDNTLEGIQTTSTPSLVSSSIHIVENTNPPQQSPPEITSSIEIHNGTWAPGLAAKMKSRLIAQGFTISAVGNSVQRPKAKSTMYIIHQKDGDTTQEKLQKELGFPLETTPPQGENYSQKSDILIIIGEDFSL